MAKIQRGQVKLAKPRVVLSAVEGYGKTSLSAFLEDTIILMDRSETGYLTLLGANTVPDVPRAVIEDWSDLLLMLKQVRDSNEYKALALDALGGFERLCHEAVCQREFNGDWGERGFASYQRGYGIAVTDWLEMLSLLDEVHQSGKAILLLSHCKVSTFKNPLGTDFDRYSSDVHDKTWAVTKKWADAVFFGKFVTIVDTDRPNAKKGKGIGGTDRVLYTQHRDAFDAKNRYGLPSEINIPNDPSQMWRTIWNHLPKKETEV